MREYVNTEIYPLTKFACKPTIRLQGSTLVMGKCCKNGGIELMVPMEQDISFFLDIEY